MSFFYSKKALCVRSTAWTTCCRENTSLLLICHLSHNSWMKRRGWGWLKVVCWVRSTGLFYRYKNDFICLWVFLSAVRLYKVTCQCFILNPIFILATFRKHGRQRLLFCSSEKFTVQSLCVCACVYLDVCTLYHFIRITWIVCLQYNPLGQEKGTG